MCHSLQVKRNTSELSISEHWRRYLIKASKFSSCFINAIFTVFFVIFGPKVWINPPTKCNAKCSTLCSNKRGALLSWSGCGSAIIWWKYAPQLNQTLFLGWKYAEQWNHWVKICRAVEPNIISDRQNVPLTLQCGVDTLSPVSVWKLVRFPNKSGLG